MILQLMSDLHFEMHLDGGQAFLASLDPTGVDVLVLAGDIFSARMGSIVRDAFAAFTSKYPQVIYLPGNHEYYRSRPADVDYILSRQEFANLHVLNPGLITLEGRRFLGATLWFPETEDEGRFRWMLNDFRQIGDFVPWVHETHRAHRRFLETNLQPGDIVVTHHLPATPSIAPQYVHDETNRFFWAQADDLVRDRGARLWLHGHTHSHVDYVLGQTRVLANPRGYPRESGCAFVERMLIEI